MEKKFEGNYTRMLRVITHKAAAVWPPNTYHKAIQVRWSRHARHSWRSRDKLIRDILLLTPSHGRAKAGRPAWTYIQQLCADTGSSPEDLPEAMDNREGWWESVRDICADGMKWCWGWPESSLFKSYNTKV